MRETSFLFGILMCIKDINTKKIEMLFKIYVMYPIKHIICEKMNFIMNENNVIIPFHVISTVKIVYLTKSCLIFLVLLFTYMSNILNMIKKGYNDVNIKCNSTKSIIGILKTSVNEEIMVHLFNKYFKTKIEEICEEYDYEGFDCAEILGKNKNLKIKKIDEMRISNNNFDASNDKI